MNKKIDTALDGTTQILRKLRLVEFESGTRQRSSHTRGASRIYPPHDTYFHAWKHSLCLGRAIIVHLLQD